MPYRLLCFDYDGTAADDGQLPTRPVLQMVAAAQARGTHVVMATGRSYYAASRYVEALGLRDPLISYQGAVVTELTPPHATLFKEVLPEEPLAEFLALAEEMDLDLSLYSEREYYITKLRRSWEFHQRWFGLPMVQAPTYTAALQAMRARGTAPIKGLVIGEADENDHLIVELHRRFDGRLNVIRSHALFTEITPPRASKGNALAFLADRFGVPRQEVIAVGDSGNDISMIRWAGLGVAMGNATPDVLAVADRVAPSVAEDGLATVIEEFVLRDGRT